MKRAFWHSSHSRHCGSIIGTTASNSNSTSTSATDADSSTSSAGLYPAKRNFQFFKADGPGAHLYLIKGRASRVFFTVLFRTLDFTYLFFLFVSDLTLSTLVLFYLYIFTLLHFSPPFTFTFAKANNPEERERYHI